MEESDDSEQSLNLREVSGEPLFFKKRKTGRSETKTKVVSNYKQIKTDRIKDYITNLPSVANKKRPTAPVLKLRQRLRQYKQLILKRQRRLKTKNQKATRI